MRLATIRQDGWEVAAVIVPDGALLVPELHDPFGSGWPTDLLSLLESGRFYELWYFYDGVLKYEVKKLSSRVIPLSKIDYGSLYRRARKIWGIGLNYVEHADDLQEIAPSEEPASFMRPDTSIIGPGEEVRLPNQSERVTGEAELGLVIGRETRNICEEEVPTVVAGVTTILDMTAEDILRKNPRYLTRAKSFDTFFSFGPQLVTLDEVGKMGDLAVATVLNGEVRRKNVVSNMTFSPAFLVSFHSKVMTLLAGDVISTGTPGAVEVQDGDVVSCYIDGFEPLSNPVRR